MKTVILKRYIVRFGKSIMIYYTDYHAEQFCRALALNGTPFTLTEE